MVQRGDCDYTTKAEVAQEGGSAALVMINTDEGSLVSIIFPQIFYDLSLFYISYTESLNISLFFKLILLLVNFIGLMEMGCGNNTNLNIRIPVITISKSGGEDLKKSMTGGMKGKSLLDV